VKLKNNPSPATSYSDGLGTIRTRTIPDLVAEQLRDAILNGTLKPGERLVELKLCAHFGIGQPTVREALRELEIQGFVRKSANRGTYVTEFSEEDVRKILELRVALEAFAIEKAAARISGDDARELRGIIDEIDASAAKFDRAALHRADVVFHQKIWAVAGNEYLQAALERIVFSLFAFMLVGRAPADSMMKHVARQHREILKGLETHDPKTAREHFIRSTLSLWREDHGIDLPVEPVSSREA
jgi:DNA-binding GntR family transcriptional regulator